MKIFVTAKQGPDTSGKVPVNPGGTFDRASMQTVINTGRSQRRKRHWP